MPMVCTVCRHASRAAIDMALVAGESYRDIAKQFGVSAAAVFRHKDSHLPAHVVQAAADEASKQAIDVIQQLKAINAASLQVLQEARSAKDGMLALSAVDRIQKQIALQARLLAEINEKPVVNIILTEEWQQVRTALLRALRPYPDAAVAVSDALASIGGTDAV